MASFLRGLTAEAIRAMTPVRAGERRLGQAIEAWKPGEVLRPGHEPGFAILLVPSDIGVKANLGRVGASALPHAALRQLLSMQDNASIDPASIVVAGEVVAEDLLAKAATLDPARADELDMLRSLVSKMDARVCEAVHAVAASGRTVVLLGGGHENAFGLLAGLHAARGKPLRCVNLDAHADLREDAGRHSGNPFAHAIRGGMLDRYAVIGLQQAWINRHMLERFHSEPALRAWTMESILHGERSIERACDEATAFVGPGACSLEVDLDVVAGMASSARSPSGLTADQLRQCVHRLAASLHPAALHVCEGIPGPDDESGAGRLAALVVRDFIRAVSRRGAAPAR
jgi:formiminoglutamase